MRAFCTVSAPLEVCASSAEQLSPGSRFLALRLLGNQQPKTLYFLVDAKSRVREVYTQTCLHFAAQGMLDTELFGLAVLIDGEYMFADPESKLSKYGPKSWRSSHTHGLDANGRPLLELHFRVQFYVESPFLLKDEISRHNYYLQLKYNAVEREMPKDYSEQSMILLAGLALQADLGDAPSTTTTTITTATKITKGAKLKTFSTTEVNSSGACGGGDQSPQNTTSVDSTTHVTNSTTTVTDTSQVTNLLNTAVTTETTTTGKATTTTTSTSTSSTTTLPKISKRLSSEGERVLRLSTFLHAKTSLATPTHAKLFGRAERETMAIGAGAKLNTTSTSHTGSSTVFPISGSLKRSLGAMAASFSAAASASASASSSSIASSINRSTISSSQTPPTTATSSSSSLAALAHAPGATTTVAAAAHQIQQPSIATKDYFNLSDYLPAELHTAWALNALQACHRENRGMSAADAELHYIQHACMVHECVNAHIYRMRASKNECGLGSSWFVVYAKGIKIFSNCETTTTTTLSQQQSQQQQHTTFLWPNITKLSFERKKFEIRSGECKILLYATSDEKNKMLLTLCRETHQFSMKIAARLKEVLKREEEEESNCLHSCYIYSRSLHLPYNKNKSDQRISVISSTSSNTTSGIVSDRVHSEDEVEIMINTPPAPIAAPSTESLALAHLLDHPSVSRQTSSVGQASLKDLEEQLAALSVVQRERQMHHSINSGDDTSSAAERSHTSAGGNSSSSNSSSNQASQRTQADSSTTTATDSSPSSQHNIGSQCSSTCSTVVVLPPPVPSSSECAVSNSPLTTLAAAAATVVVGSSTATMNTTPIQPRRRDSTSSSLELGFSHTAQNSILSESADSTCIDHDFASSSARDENESVSGVYTLAHGAPPTETSGVYTMHSSEMTGQSSEIAESEKSSHYGIFQPTTKAELSADNLLASHAQADSVDGGVVGGSVGGSSIGSIAGRTYHGKRIKHEQFRLRSDSNVSTSDSFRGDGSDPTDNKHTLLSAEELTELIVGRGTYPNRKTVSGTLDSDCDYVTLPPLPIKGGESYIQGHQDTAPTEDQVEDLINDLIATDPPAPPAPPQRVDSNSANSIVKQHAANPLSNIRMRSPPPYHARHEKTGLCGPPVVCATNKPVSAVIAAPTPPSSTATTFSKVPSPKIPNEIINKKTPIVALTPTASTPTPAPAPVLAPPSVAPTVAALRRRDPPPYPIAAKPTRPTSLVSLAESNTSTSSSSARNHSKTSVRSSVASGSLSSLKNTEEAPARIITTRPHINILKAHTSVINDIQKPSYAAPTHYSSSAASSVGSMAGQHLSSSQLSQHSAHNSHYMSGSQLSLSSGSVGHAARQSSYSAAAAAAMAHAAAAAAAGATVIPNTLGVPMVPYRLHGSHSSMSSLHQQPPPPPPPYSECSKSTQPRTCVLLPVIKHHRQFLPPPPPSLPRQPPPPPPPPPPSAGVYGNQLARKQLELYQQQLYSDVDYVIYPLQDPAVSQQEYLDAKQSSLYAAMAHTHAHPHAHPAHHPYLAYHHAGSAHAVGSWDTCKAHALYRSTPYLPLALSTHSRYASTQNLSDTYVQLPSAYSPLYSPSMASLCSSYEPPPPLPPLHPAAAALAAAATQQHNAASSNLFTRSRSDDNILNSLDSLPKMKRMPPPPPPPYVNRRLKKPPMPTPSEHPPPIPTKPAAASNMPSKVQVTMRSQLPPRKPPTLNTSGNSASMTRTSSGAQWAGERPKPDLSSYGSSILAQLQASVAAAAAANRQAVKSAKAHKTATTTAEAKSTKEASRGGGSPSAAAAAAANNAAAALDIAVLREKSKNLDLPLISALCNDHSLLKQTKVFANTKTSRTTAGATSAATSASLAARASPNSGTRTTVVEDNETGNNTYNNKALNSAANEVGNAAAAISATVSASASATTNSAATTTTVAATTKSPTITTNTNSTAVKARKTAGSHRHPNDKLPPLPMQMAEANNYVMDPAVTKHHKGYNAQT